MTLYDLHHVQTTHTASDALGNSYRIYCNCGYVAGPQHSLESAVDLYGAHLVLVAFDRASEIMKGTDDTRPTSDRSIVRGTGGILRRLTYRRTPVEPPPPPRHQTIRHPDTGVTE